MKLLDPMSIELKDTILLIFAIFFLVMGDVNGWIIATIITLSMFIKEWKDGGYF